MGEESTCNTGDAGDSGLIPRWGRSPGEGHGNALYYSCLENLMERGARGLQSILWQSVRHNWACTHAIYLCVKGLANLQRKKNHLGELGSEDNEWRHQVRMNYSMTCNGNTQDNIHPSLGGMKKVLIGGWIFVSTRDVHKSKPWERGLTKEGTTPRNSGSKTSKHHIRTDWDVRLEKCPEIRRRKTFNLL